MKIEYEKLTLREYIYNNMPSYLAMLPGGAIKRKHYIQKFLWLKNQVYYPEELMTVFNNTISVWDKSYLPIAKQLATRYEEYMESNDVVTILVRLEDQPPWEMDG